MSTWIVTSATSSNEDFGPSLMALEVDAELLKALKVLRVRADDLAEELGGYGRISWFCANIVAFDEPEEGPLSESLPLSGYLWCDAETVERAVADTKEEWQVELCALTVFSTILADNAVYAQASVEHTSIRIESTCNLAQAFKEIENDPLSE